MTIVLFMSISTYGAMVLSGVVEEKSSRTVEVLLARMPARNLLAGKIAGIGLLGLAQIAATALVALIAVTMVDTVDLPAVRGSRARLGGRVVRARLRALRHGVRRPRVARLAHRGRAERRRPGRRRPGRRLLRVVRRRSAAQTPPGRDWCRGSRPPRRSPCRTASPWARPRWWDPLLAADAHPRRDRRPRRARRTRLREGHPPHRTEASSCATSGDTRRHQGRVQASRLPQTSPHNRGPEPTEVDTRGVPARR